MIDKLWIIICFATSGFMAGLEYGVFPGLAVLTFGIGIAMSIDILG